MTAHSLLPLPDGCIAACPGCRHRQWSLADSLAQKQAYLAKTLTAWNETLAPVASVVPEHRWAYRRRVKLAAAHQDRRWHFGLEPHGEFLAIDTCPAHQPRIAGLLALLAENLPPPDIFPLRFLVVSDAQVVLVVKTAQPVSGDWLTPAVIERFAGLGFRGLWLNHHPAAGKVLFAKRGWRHLWGETRSRDATGLLYGPGVFLQQLPELHAASLNRAEAFLAPDGASSVADMYCGLGASLRRWTATGARVLGLDCDGEALACAAINAPGTTLLRGLGAQRRPQLEAWREHQIGRRLLAYLNPPRLGLEPAILDWLIGAQPERIAYLSCSAGTLARDLAGLTAAGYRVEALQPYDFFPQTPHVETLALLRRR